SALATTMPAMAVPGPRQSVSPRPLPATMSAPTVRCPVNAGRLPSAPESTMATMTPAPRVYVHTRSGASRSVAHCDCALSLMGFVPAHRVAVAAVALGAAGAGTVAGGGPGGGGWPGVGVLTTVGSGPYPTPGPTASQGSTSSQPTCSWSGLVRVPPSGW